MVSALQVKYLQLRNPCASTRQPNMCQARSLLSRAEQPRAPRFHQQAIKCSSVCPTKIGAIVKFRCRLSRLSNLVAGWLLWDVCGITRCKCCVTTVSITAVLCHPQLLLNVLLKPVQRGFGAPRQKRVLATSVVCATLSRLDGSIPYGLLLCSHISCLLHLLIWVAWHVSNWSSHIHVHVHRTLHVLR